jgi:hypothetical protein
MNVEEWFKKGTGFKIKKLRYLKPPKVPYFLYTNKEEYRGADLVINIVENNITIERYSNTNSESDLEDINKVNDFLDKNNYEYDTQTEWLNSEDLYGTFWILSPIVEKIRKEVKNYE